MADFAPAAQLVFFFSKIRLESRYACRILSPRIGIHNDTLTFCCVVFELCEWTDRQTGEQTDIYLSQYFAPLPVAK